MYENVYTFLKKSHFVFWVAMLKMTIITRASSRVLHVFIFTIIHLADTFQGDLPMLKNSNISDKSHGLTV